MSIFGLRQFVIDEYSKYVQSFLSIADERVRAFIENRSKKLCALRYAVRELWLEEWTPEQR
jgi:hypothetical protein